MAKKEKEPQIYKRLICRSKDGASVYEVKGREIRDRVNAGFALGCHDLACDYVPKGEIWVEQLPDATDMCFNANHEITERFLMGVNISGTPLSYNKCHGIALGVEERDRKLGKCEPCGVMLSALTADAIEFLSSPMWAKLLAKYEQGGRCH